MSQQNVELARQAYDAYNREGINGILRYLDADVQWRNPADAPVAGLFVGHEGVAEWQRLTEEVWDEVRLEPVRINELPDGRILAVIRLRFRVSAHEIDMEVPFVHLIRIRGGKAISLSMYTSEAAALEAAGQTGANTGIVARADLQSSAVEEEHERRTR